MMCMVEDIVYENGMVARFSKNIVPSHSCVRLYSPDNRMIASAPTDAEHAKATATGLMYGYMSGWSDCGRAIRVAVADACQQSVQPR